jgi:hypothetical protein
VTLGDWTGTAHEGERFFISGNASTSYSWLFAYLSGAFYSDGVSVSSASYPKRGYQLLETVIASPATASNFCNDRNWHAGDQSGVPINRQGGICLREVLVFTNALSTTERSDISAYLKKKWFSAPPTLSAVGSGRYRSGFRAVRASASVFSGNGSFRQNRGGNADPYGQRGDERLFDGAGRGNDSDRSFGSDPAQRFASDGVGKRRVRQ